MSYDIAIIGGGVVGTAIARELSRYALKAILLEARPELGDESSKGNSALMCSGVDVPAGTLERKLVARGYARYCAEAPAMSLPIRKVGAIVLAWTEEQEATLTRDLADAQENGFAAEALDSAEIYRHWPHFGLGIRCGLWLPDEAIVDPFSTPYAYALDAIGNGVEIRRAWRVQRVEQMSQGWRLHGSDGTLEARCVVNAGGIRGDEVEALAGYSDFAIRPRRGQYMVLDKSARAIHDVIAMPAPTPTTRGILIAPTIFGNVLVGPTAEDVADRDDRQVTEDGLRQLRQAIATIAPALADQPVNTIFAGMRPATQFREYQIIPRLAQRWLTVGGIRSTGLSASLGIAEYVATLLIPELFDVPRKPGMRPVTVPDLSETSQRPWQDGARIQCDPAYAEMVCHCERITLGEIRDALASPLAPTTLNGLKRRTRAMFGRCQGFYCGARVQAMLNAQGT
ncbi:MAG TPA: NAD(P)/FAD-dependent oxidoreductase [Dongiaceae bacterium]|nr:NAD(P)/FAD-dependent oxidoreductase [Dongiaceae bacterium]